MCRSTNSPVLWSPSHPHPKVLTAVPANRLAEALASTPRRVDRRSRASDDLDASGRSAALRSKALRWTSPVSASFSWPSADSGLAAVACTCADATEVEPTSLSVLRHAQQATTRANRVRFATYRGRAAVDRDSRHAPPISKPRPAVPRADFDRRAPKDPLACSCASAEAEVPWSTRAACFPSTELRPRSPESGPSIALLCRPKPDRSKSGLVPHTDVVSATERRVATSTVRMQE